MASKCNRCGLPMHPDLVKCQVCGELISSEQRNRSKFFSFGTTISISLVAVAVIARTLTAGDVAIGMSQSDCLQIQSLVKETRYAVESLTSDSERAEIELNEVSQGWGTLSQNYVPGKYSWSTSGLEHRWLERLATVTKELAQGSGSVVEDDLEPSAYAIELLKLKPRFCSQSY
jgi:predicted nucleic acid-binding Zn ribbon protein